MKNVSEKYIQETQPTLHVFVLVGNVEVRQSQGRLNGKEIETAVPVRYAKSPGRTGSDCFPTSPAESKGYIRPMDPTSEDPLGSAGPGSVAYRVGFIANRVS